MKKTLTDTDVCIPANEPGKTANNPEETAEASGMATETGPADDEVVADGSEATATCAEDAPSASIAETDPEAAPTAEETPPCTQPSYPPDLEARLAEAETRGYLRGRNERIEQLMREPAIFERQRGHPSIPSSQASGEEWQADSQPMILNNPRVSIWDR